MLHAYRKPLNVDELKPPDVVRPVCCLLRSSCVVHDTAFHLRIYAFLLGLALEQGYRKIMSPLFQIFSARILQVVWRRNTHQKRQTEVPDIH